MDPKAGKDLNGALGQHLRGPSSPEAACKYVSVDKHLFFWGDVHRFHDNFKGVHDSTNVKSRNLSETSYFTDDSCVAQGGEVIQGHS